MIASSLGDETGSAETIPFRHPNRFWKPWGLLWGPDVYLEESRYISNQLSTTPELYEPKRVAGFSVSVQQLSDLL
jgi:hypothetical protein